MSKVHGLDHFTAFFAGLEADFVLIGGTAASVLMDDAGLAFRETKDLDVVILSNGSQALQTRLQDYVAKGGYTAQQAKEGPRYYRFIQPTAAAFPKMLEVFARNEFELKLNPGQHIIPISGDAENPLSAILLDDEYFDLVVAHAKQVGGHRVIDTPVNICLKARAHRDMLERKAKGENIDSKQIDKHKKDVCRLVAALTADAKFPLTGQPRIDLQEIVKTIKFMPENQFDDIMKATGATGMSVATTISTLTDTFEI